MFHCLNFTEMSQQTIQFSTGVTKATMYNDCDRITMKHSAQLDQCKQQHLLPSRITCLYSYKLLKACLYEREYRLRIRFKLYQIFSIYRKVLEINLIFRYYGINVNKIKVMQISYLINGNSEQFCTVTNGKVLHLHKVTARVALSFVVYDFCCDIYLQQNTVLL